MITPADVGKRVSVQFYEDDGSKREATGVFERAEMNGKRAILFIRRRDDSILRIPLDRVSASRVIR